MNKANLTLGFSFGLLLCAAMVLFQSQAMEPEGGGGASTTLTSSQVGSGSGANAVTSEAAFAYDAANDRLTVGQVRAAAGTAANPGFTFTGFTSTGLFPGAGVLNFSVAGSLPFILSSTAIVPLVRYESVVGTGAAPGLTFGGDLNTGLSAQVADNLVFSAGGAGATLNPTEFRTAATVYSATGHSAAGAPTAADCDNDAEIGRFSIDTTNERFYVCNGAARGWDYAALTD
jgi:hypothetical protein